MTGTHCDALGCHTWSTKPRKHGFLSVKWDGRKLHFCSWDCCMKYAATKEPLTTID